LRELKRGQLYKTVLCRVLKDNMSVPNLANKLGNNQSWFKAIRSAWAMYVTAKTVRGATTQSRAFLRTGAGTLFILSKITVTRQYTLHQKKSHLPTSTTSSNLSHHTSQHPSSNNPTIQSFPQNHFLIYIPLRSGTDKSIYPVLTRL
jgi:hypothetical protein